MPGKGSGDKSRDPKRGFQFAAGPPVFQTPSAILQHLSAQVCSVTTSQEQVTTLEEGSEPLDMEGVPRF